MVRRTFRLGLWAGLLVGVAAVLMKTMHIRRDSRDLAAQAGWGGTQTAITEATAPTAAPIKPVPAAKRVAKTDATWVSSVDGICPPSHPVKGKLTSRLFHLPGMFAYDRTRADRCYASEAAATADGLTKAKR